MFTKAQPNSLWQGTEEKVTACAAAKFRRFKKVLLYLQWMWLMSGRPRESGWLILCRFRRRGDQGFFSFFSPRLHFLVILRKMRALSGELAISIWLGEGRAPSARRYTNPRRGRSRGHDAGDRLIPRRMCVIGDCRGQTLNESMPGSIRAAFNLAGNAERPLSVQWPFIRWNLITAFGPYQQQERQEINGLENIRQLCHAEYNLIVL